MIELIEVNFLRIFTLFSLAPGIRLNRKSIQDKTGINNIILDKTLNFLVNNKYLLRKSNFYSLNLDKDSANALIELASIRYNYFKKLPLKEYFVILDILNEFSKIKNIGDAYLFGSYSKLIFNEKSDIDIAIISEKVNKKDVNKIINKMEKKIKKVIEVHYFSKNFYNNKKDPLVKEILKDGIKLI